MKVILIDNSIDTTGASKSLFNAMKELRTKGGIDCIFIYPTGSKRTAVVKDSGFAAYEIPFTEIRRSLRNIILYFPYLILNGYRISKIVKKEGVQIIHVNDLYNMAGLMSKLFCSVKVITHIRRMPESFPLFLYRIWSYINVWFADRIIAVSVANKTALPLNKKTDVVYNPLPDVERYGKYIPKPLLNKKIKILYLANYNYGKGHIYAVDVLARAVKVLPDWDFILDMYGGDFGLEINRQCKFDLKQKVNEFGLNDIVHFYGQVNDVEAKMKEYDLVLNLSDSESFSRLTMEALYYGVPIIATDVGGTREMLINGKSGFLVKRKDPEDMYQAFNKLVLDDDLRVSFSYYGYLHVREHFTMEKTSEKIKTIYQEVLTSRSLTKTSIIPVEIEEKELQSRKTI